MAPSAVRRSTSPDAASYDPGTKQANSNYQVNGLTPNALCKTNDDEVHDLLCVGFGPASLAIAVALYDTHEEDPMFHPKVRFIERQLQFRWHAGMLLPGAKMQISFIKDLATMRNPQSRFTFLNYLKENNRLSQFANLDTFLPLRIEFEDYLKWVAGHFENVVEYANEVLSVNPVKWGGGDKFDCLEVVSRNVVTGEQTSLLGRNVVIAVGGRPSMPSVFPPNIGRVIHSSQYNHMISSLLKAQDKPYNVAVVGGGQSAAEVFNDLHNRYPNSTTQLIIRDTALRPSDDSPFVNEVFDPEIVDQFYQRTPESRLHEIYRNKATNYSVVRLNLLERLYEDLYHQYINEPDRNKWQHRILTTREIVEVTEVTQDQKVNLTLTNRTHTVPGSKEILTVDAVVLATGYSRNAHIDMLRNCQVINGDMNGEWSAGRDYQVKINRDFADHRLGIWLQGCNEMTHGLSDTLLSILATRSGELVQSMFGKLSAKELSNLYV